MLGCALAFFSLLISGCADADKTSEASASAIQGGAAATTQTYALAFVNDSTSCSATLIAPNLVLTARHCVEGTLPTDPKCLNGALAEASHIFVTTASALGQGNAPWYGVTKIEAAPAVDGCAPDLALAFLSENVPASEATPAALAIAKPAKHFSPVVTVIGHGMDEAGNSGERRIRENLRVLCVPGDSEFPCAPEMPTINSFEFVVDRGACHGDSGAGVYDQRMFDQKQPIVVGTVSRGATDENGICKPGAYVRVDAFGAFLTEAARAAAKGGGYAVPTWAR